MRLDEQRLEQQVSGGGLEYLRSARDLARTLFGM
jgi:hypothetical protein